MRCPVRNVERGTRNAERGTPLNPIGSVSNSRRVSYGGPNNSMQLSMPSTFDPLRPEHACEP